MVGKRLCKRIWELMTDASEMTFVYDSGPFQAVCLAHIYLYITFVFF